jgi:guanylate kinase
MPAKSQRALLIVVSAPSGTGKTTLCDRLRADFPAMKYSVSCTTRAPRGAEVDGEDYHFLTEEEFQRRVDAGLFLEHARVHGCRYGTLKSNVEGVLQGGSHVLMDIDVQGARQIRQQAQRAPEGDRVRRGFVDFFIRPPSLEALRLRLERRGEDSAETIESRLQAAGREMASQDEFRYVVVNDDLDRAYAEFKTLVMREMDGHG